MACLKDTWAAGPRTLLAVSTAGFANLFILAGPGSPSVLTNVMASIEQQVEWLGDLVDYVLAHDVTSVEATLQAQDAWRSAGLPAQVHRSC